ncbi:MAG: aminomethyltransferase family protein [Deltaproteobacteria bacterium]|nr:aminomethyltransferase family protein [Deltaproteobacteria bacterium]
MRTSPIRDLLAERGAVFVERAGVEVVVRFSDPLEEYEAVRGAAGITDFSFCTRHRVPEEGLDALERYAAGSVANIRFGRVLHTAALDDEGMLESDLYVANDDENLLVFGESLVPDDRTAATLEKVGGAEAGVVDISTETALIGLDGFKAWAVVKELFGPDVLGLPYLSIENYELDGVEIKLVRGGKTSEFGYLLLVPAAEATAIWKRIEDAGAPHDLVPIGVQAHSMLRLDGRFFNIHEEGRAVRDPLPLGLQWMVDFDGDEFRGQQPLLDRREAGYAKKIIGVHPGDAAGALATGDAILHQGEQVAEVIVACDSPTLGRRVGLALFDLPYAYSGLELEGDDGRSIQTISLPPFTPKSLTVKLDEM